MILPDANVLVYAFRRDAVGHGEYRGWLESTLSQETVFGVSDIVLSAVIRIVTHPKVFGRPSTLQQAFHFAEWLLQQDAVIRLHPGQRHWAIFASLCKKADARGNLITDAYLAALAIETGGELVTTDRDFARFPGLRWRHPLR